MVQSLDPENSLDNAAAQPEVVTTAAHRVSPSGAQGKRSLRPARHDHQQQHQENQLVHSRSRRQSLRTVTPSKSAQPTLNASRSQPNLRMSLNSAYPTPERSDTSRGTKKSARGRDDRRQVKSTTSKLQSPAPSESLPRPPSPVIYDSIEVRSPPPDAFELKDNSSAKRKNQRVPARRSKRIKLDTGDNDNCMGVEATAKKKTNRLRSSGNAKPPTLIPEIVKSADTPIEQNMQVNSFQPGEKSHLASNLALELHPSIDPDTLHPSSGELIAGDENMQSHEPDVAESSAELATGIVEEYSESLHVPMVLPNPSDQPQFHELHDYPVSSMDFTSIERFQEPTEDVNDWLMTDVEQSIEEEAVPEATLERLEENVAKGKSPRQEVNDPEFSRDHVTIPEAAINPTLEPLAESLECVDDQPELTKAVSPGPSVSIERSISLEVPVTQEEHEETAVSSTEVNEREAVDEDAMKLDLSLDLDVGLSPEDPPKVVPHSDPVSALIDETRMSMSGSAIDSPSPPLRTILPRLKTSLDPLLDTRRQGRQSSLSREISKADSEADSEAGEFQETADEFARSTMAMPAESSKQTSMSPYPKFEVPATRSARLSVEPQRRPVPQSVDVSSANLSRVSSLSGSLILPTPPAQSPSPVARPSSPSFGLRTTPRPNGRPPSRPSRGGLRHVNHDSDVRSKLLMARPKTAIPTHMDPADYARECLEAAMSSRLPPYSLHPDEHRLLRTHINHVQVTTYLNIRNGILRLWMLNPTIAVCREEALGVAKEDRHLDMAAKCHEFLVRHGHINFGCIQPPRPLSRAVELPNYRTDTSKRRKRIVVIGAGAAGLGCGRHLESLIEQFADRFPRNSELPEVVVLEGRNRVGGRLHSYPISSPTATDKPGSSIASNSKFSILSTSSSLSLSPVSRKPLPDQVVDLGAQIVTGFDNGNPLAAIVKRQLRLRWHDLHDDSLLFNDLDGERVDRHLDFRAERLFNDILDRTSSVKEKTRERTLIEGDRELIEQGKEPHGESGRQIAKVEENEAVLPPMPPSPPLSSRETPLSHQFNQPSTRVGPQRTRVPVRRALAKLSFKVKDSEVKSRDNERESPERHETLGDTMRSILLDIQGIVDLSPMDLKLLNWHWANLEYGNATNLNKLSLKHWDQDDVNEFLGAHAMIVGGYGQLAYGLASSPNALDIRYCHDVEQISYTGESNRRTAGGDSPGVTILCNNGKSVQADAVVVTVSLGVLKSGKILFEPELPAQKRDAIERLGFGLINKVVLVYDRPFWDTDADCIGCLRTPQGGDLHLQDSYEHDRGRFYLIWNCTPSCGRPTLVALMAGDAAFQAEEESDEDLVHEMTTLLTRIHNVEHLPNPVHAIVTRWGKDPFALGSYSFVGPEATGEDYDVLGKPVDNKVFFAGEATCRTHPATVHGAYMSGLRAANEVLESFIGQIEMPPDDILIPKKNHPVRNPLMDRSSIPEVRRRTDPESHRYKARNIKRARFSRIVEECQERILSELGPRPHPPKKYHPNAFLLFQKDKWEIAKEKAKERYTERDDPADYVTRDDVRASMGRMWRDLPEDEKQRYLERVDAEKSQYKEEMSTFAERLRSWEENVARIKQETTKKMDEVELTEEEKDLIEAAREEEQLEVVAREEKENLRRFYGEVGMECLISEDEEDQAEVTSDLIHWLIAGSLPTDGRCCAEPDVAKAGLEYRVRYGKT